MLKSLSILDMNLKAGSVAQFVGKNVGCWFVSLSKSCNEFEVDADWWIMFRASVFCFPLEFVFYFYFEFSVLFAKDIVAFHWIVLLMSLRLYMDGRGEHITSVRSFSEI